MAIMVIGNSGTIAEVGESFRELFVGSRPISYGAFGHYLVATRTGAIAAGMTAASAIFQARWADTTRLMVLTKVLLSGMYTTTAFAAGGILFELVSARAYTGQAGSGTNIVFTTNNQKLRTNMGSSLFALSGVMQISATAALTGGTHVVDLLPFGMINSHSSAGYGAAAPIIGNAFLPTLALFVPDIAAGEHPAIFATNEGFIIRGTVPTTGVWLLGITVGWTECLAY